MFIDSLLDAKKVDVFLSYCEGASEEDILSKYSLSSEEYSSWIVSDWWQSLSESFKDYYKQLLERRLKTATESVLDGFFDVMNSRDPRTASARVSGFKAFYEAVYGKKALKDDISEEVLKVDIPDTLEEFQDLSVDQQSELVDLF